MIDFKKLLKDKGVPGILKEEMPWIRAYRASKRDKSDLHPVNVQFEIKKAIRSNGETEFWLHLIGGPTGYESVNLVALLQNPHNDAVWIANMGSHVYDYMEVTISDIREAVKNYSVNYSFEVL